MGAPRAVMVATVLWTGYPQRMLMSEADLFAKDLLGERGRAWLKPGGVCVVGKWGIGLKCHYGTGASWEEACEKAARLKEGLDALVTAAPAPQAPSSLV